MDEEVKKTLQKQLQLLSERSQEKEEVKTVSEEIMRLTAVVLASFAVGFSVSNLVWFCHYNKKH
jgi:hypothetical protein